MKKTYVLVGLIMLAIVLFVIIVTMKPKTNQTITPIQNNGVTATTTPPYSVVSTSTLVGLDLTKPLPISYQYFKNPKTYVNTYIGFAFDYEDGTLEAVNPVINNFGTDDENITNSLSVMYEKNQQHGSPYDVGSRGVLKFNMISQNINSSSTKRALIVDITGCASISTNCYINNVAIDFTYRQKFYNSITDISQINGSSFKDIAGITTPNLQFTFFPSVYTGSSTEDIINAQNLFKSLATFRLLNN